MDMNISSLIKVFGIAAAGFVPQAQANPFGISFVKVDPPKDKKEQAICFRLKLSPTDVFSEHNFTDITFRPDTTVFLQKQMIIDDEKETLEKTVKNFNAEKDPFEIPDKYLPLEDKDRAEWVDKDGKPLKFLVTMRVYKGYEPWWGGVCYLDISGYPKQSLFFVSGKVGFLDGVDCINDGHGEYIMNLRKESLSLDRDYRCRLILYHYTGGAISAEHVPSGLRFSGLEGKFSLESSICIVTEVYLHYTDTGSSEPSPITIKGYISGSGDVIAITRWDPRIEFFAPEVRIKRGEYASTQARREKKTFRLQKTEDSCCDVTIFRDVSNGDSLSIFNDKVKLRSNEKRWSTVHCLVFFFLEKQDKTNK